MIAGFIIGGHPSLLREALLWFALAFALLALILQRRAQRRREEQQKARRQMVYRLEKITRPDGGAR